MARLARLAYLTGAVLWVLSATAIAGPTEDANAVLDRWSAAYSGNDPETIAEQYWPDAILLGTVSPVISQGHDAIVKYFVPTKGTGNKNAVQERRAIAIDDNAVLLTG